MGKFNYFSYKEKHFDKLSPEKQAGLVFDLINAFSIMKTSIDTALFIQDLLTETEVRNLAKRLRIAKLLLSGQTVREIAIALHTSFATVSKVNIWLENSGEGFKKVISRLPQPRKVYKLKKSPGIGYGLPQILLHFASTHLKEKEKKQLQQFLENMRWKASVDQDFKEEISQGFRERRKK